MTSDEMKQRNIATMGEHADGPPARRRPWPPDWRRRVLRDGRLALANQRSATVQSTSIAGTVATVIGAESFHDQRRRSSNWVRYLCC
jgi:hypothetical protein